MAQSPSLHSGLEKGRDLPLNSSSTMKRSSLLTLGLPGLVLVLVAIAPLAKTDNHKPIKALMVTGEGYHDYENQKVIISEGVSKRMPVEWTIMHNKNPEECKANLTKEGWADAYDIVVYNICHAKENDVKFIDSVAAVHHAGKPAVAIHCTMHSFHWNVKVEDGEEKTWNKFLGVSSRGHGPKKPITVSRTESGKEHQVTKDLPEGWKTPEGELYNVQKVLEGTNVLAFGDNGVVKEPQACIWVNTYGEGRVMSTTIGHHNSTMQTDEFLDLIANGMKWAIGHE